MDIQGPRTVTSSAPVFRLRLAKEDFKFSAAHFTLFPDGSAELLHGHNYQLTVELGGEDLDEVGLLCDLARLKVAIRAACEHLDERTLVPAESSALQVAPKDGGESLEFRCGERTYRLPAADVLLLPLVNTSIELLAEHLWRELAVEARACGRGLTDLSVEVAETAGQSCRYRAALPAERG